MSDEMNRGRRKFLTATTCVVGAVGAGFAAVPFIKSWQPSARARAAGAPVEVDISLLEPGQIMQAEWRGKVIFVVHRTQRMLDLLPGLSDRLRDPDSLEEQQPAYAQNAYRSLRPEILVLVGLCTHLGCSPKPFFEVEAQPFDAEWKGGFFCPCHSSRFDMSGRVFAGVPAPTNLVVPPYQFLDDKRILIGVDAEGVS